METDIAGGPLASLDLGLSVNPIWGDSSSINNVEVSKELVPTESRKNILS